MCKKGVSRVTPAKNSNNICTAIQDNDFDPSDVSQGLEII